MRTQTRLARYLVPCALVVGLLSLGAPCAAQEAEAPALDAARDGRGSVFVPGGFLGVVAPVQDRVSLNLYGFYYGEVQVPVAQVDVPIRAARFLTITPSYLYYEVPPSGLDTASQRPAGFTDTFEENQFRIDAIREVPDSRSSRSPSRNMYVRRFRPTDDINRYRQRIAIAHPRPGERPHLETVRDL